MAGGAVLAPWGMAPLPVSIAILEQGLFPLPGRLNPPWHSGFPHLVTVGSTSLEDSPCLRDPWGPHSHAQDKAGASPESLQESH